MRRGPMLAALALSVACADSRPAAPDVTQARWDEARTRLSRLRASFPSHAYTQSVTVDFFEPRSRRRFEGRGAVGVDPGRAMRMILIGPAGEPALDVWVTRDAWRLVVPAIRLTRRGGADTPKGTPIGFFRSWFVEPLAGRLLAIGPGGALVIRDPFGGTLHVSGTSESGRIRRRSGTSAELFSYERDARGGSASYVDESTGLSVEVKLGPIQSEPPDPAAFVDPERGGS